MELSDFYEYWHFRIARDMSPFADPGTTVQIDARSGRVNVSWQVRGNEECATFALAPEQVTVTYMGKRMTYKSFLSSEAMADLRGLARMILQTHKAPFYVETKAHAALPETNGPSRPALELLSELLKESGAEGLTQIVFVTGEAGAGKTHVLRELVRAQALKYDQGQDERLLLYINAQGRALARFNEALATELQDLRSKVTYHALAALVRAELVVPVVDGFDELLGASGYEDAFSSLAGFIEELNGHGRVIASARSSYYQLEFVARANTESSLGSQAWRLSPVEVEAWGEDEFESFVTQALATRIELSHEERRDVRGRLQRGFEGANAHLKGKPFFVARAFELALGGEAFEGSGDLLEQLVLAYLNRECSQKLLDRTGAPLLTAVQLNGLMVTIAEEMWNQETRELDKRSVREIAEFALIDYDLPESSRDMAITRVPSLAFLRPSGDLGRIGFEHEMFFSYFLAYVVAEVLVSSEIRLRMLLGKSQLPEEVAARSAGAIAARADAVRGAVARLGDCASAEDRRSGQVQENAGVLVAWVLREAARLAGSVSGVECRAVRIPGVSLQGVEVVDSIFDHVTFFRTDLRAARFLRCTGRSLTLTDTLVDAQVTRLEFGNDEIASGIYGIRVVSAGGIEIVHEPARIKEVLIQCGALKPTTATVSARRAVDRDLVKLIERLSRVYNRCNPITPSDDSIHNLFDNPLWPDLERVLLSHGIVTAESRSAGGRKKRFLRRHFLPDQIIAGVNPAADLPREVRDFWSELEQRFPG